MGVKKVENSMVAGTVGSDCQNVIILSNHSSSLRKVFEVHCVPGSNGLLNYLQDPALRDFKNNRKYDEVRFILNGALEYGDFLY